MKRWKFFVLLLAAGWQTGCAHVKSSWNSGKTNVTRYSIESYQGPFPIPDRRYTETPP